MAPLATALIATASLSAPLAVGPAARLPSEPTVIPNPAGLVVESDPRTGVWLYFPAPGGERLLRTDEAGQAVSVGLPRKLRGEELALTHLRDGWTLATNRYWPGGREQEESCHPSYAHSSSLTRRGARARAVSGCGELVVAELSPHGRWTKVQTLINTDAAESWVSDPVEVHGKIELAWAELGREVGDLLGIRVSAAAAGRAFGYGRALPRAAEEAEDVTISNLHHQMYLHAAYGKKKNGYEPKYVVERRIDGDGRLGPKHILRGKQVGLPGAPLEGAHDAELFVYEDFSEALVVARRIDHAPRYEKPRLIVPHVWNAIDYTAQTPNHRSLVSLEQSVSGRERIIAIELSPDGHPGPIRPVQYRPRGSEETPHWVSAISNSGDALIPVMGPSNQLQLHFAAPRCPAYGSYLFPAEVATVAVAAGAKGVFHLIWEDPTKQVHVASVRVHCVRAP